MKQSVFSVSNHKTGSVCCICSIRKKVQLSSMCCGLAGIFTCIIVIINTILGTGFLIIAIFGILLRFILPFVKSALEFAFLHLGLTNLDKNAFAEFLQLRSKELSNVCLIFGIICFCLCIIACMLVCCGSFLLQRIYAATLGIMVFLEGIGILILFSTQNLFIQSTTKFLSFLLGFFDGGSGFSTVIWSLIMQPNNGVRCCGMVSAQDFRVSYLPQGICPEECCGNLASGNCRCDLVQMSMIFGCKSRIESVLRIEMRTITLVCLGILLIQFILFMLIAATLMFKLRICRCECPSVSV
nr:tetraspanin [Hymenolepis microstoma]